MYIFIHLCDDLQISVICYLSYDVQWFYFWSCVLSIERAAAHPLHLSLFSLGVKLLAIIEIATTLYLFTWHYGAMYMYFEDLNLQVL